MVNIEEFYHEKHKKIEGFKKTSHRGAKTQREQREEFGIFKI